MDLNTIGEVVHPASRAELPVWTAGDAWLAGGTWLFSEPQDHLKRLVDLAHARGIKVYLDVITNNTADIIRYAENQYTYRGKADAPYQDTSGRAFEDRNYADGSRAFPTTDANAGPYTPTFASPADATVKVPAWLNNPAMYHNRGDSTFSGENSEYGDFFGLDDLFTERHEVVDGLIDVY